MITYKKFDAMIGNVQSACAGTCSCKQGACREEQVIRELRTLSVETCGEVDGPFVKALLEPVGQTLIDHFDSIVNAPDAKTKKQATRTAHAAIKMPPPTELSCAYPLEG